MDIEDKFNDIQKEFEWRKWAGLIPFIQFKPNWLVQPIPPFQQSIVRFCITTEILKEYKMPHTSVYLDCYDKLGYYGQPYWEIYGGDFETYRCDMENVNGLLEYIQLTLDLKFIHMANDCLQNEPRKPI